ncbi:putative cofilin tropomyosin-type actin-binding protein [Rosellinia necatrix]|uniref:Putative cofilin tropomyosin-type actin-binding protein n=1 Tax=Rosellinia necatrix TaxID=77044 RepID=A0A1W2TWM3_ROSNE|nr:putative cofilin tropomyosin-type actin-binding protein [Rosellinia necatrix]
MSGVDAPEILAAYEAVRSDKDATNWLLISYAGAVGDRVKLSGTGSGGLAELASRLDDGQAQYGYARVEYANDTESRRVKFALVIWIGPETRVMRKARVGFESGAIKRVLAHHSIQVDATDRADLDEKKEIVPRLRRAGGADYNGGRG